MKLLLLFKSFCTLVLIYRHQMFLQQKDSYRGSFQMTTCHLRAVNRDEKQYISFFLCVDYTLQRIQLYKGKNLAVEFCVFSSKHRQKKTEFL